LEHVPDCILSDHNPVILHLTLNKPSTTSAVRKTSHFKANLAVLKWPGVLEILETAWKAHSSTTLDLRVQFTLACDRLREKYKELQESVKALDEVLEVLKADERRLKSELEEGNDPADIQDLLSKTTQLKQVEEDQALHWRQL
jgi:hypothetical protein